MRLLSINPDNPQEHKIEQAVEALSRGGIIIYPTDTVYAIGCDIFNHKALERLCRIKKVKPEKAHFSFICQDISDIAKYAKQIDNQIFKLMKKALPGPFTFILKAAGNVPKLIQPKKKTIGVRVTSNNITQLLVERLGHPIITTSIKDEDDVIEYSTDPELIYERFEKQVDLVIDGGYGENIASTVVNCSEGAIEVVREGLGDIHQYI